MTELDLADVDLVGTHPRMPLVMEMLDATLFVLDDTLPDEVRHYHKGRETGYRVGFGLADSNAHDLALCHPRASADLDVADLASRFKTYWSQDDRNDFAEACGVLRGYKMSTSELPDAEECISCGSRIRTDLDDYTECLDDVRFCARPDCDNSYDHSPACRRERNDDERAEAYVDAYLDGDL